MLAVDAHAGTPQVRSTAELGDAAWSRLVGKGQDHPAERKERRSTDPVQLATRGRREDDAAARHPSARLVLDAALGHEALEVGIRIHPTGLGVLR